ncbi:cell wall hydrolase [Fervidicella metallireducens AeB]|uniref:Spore cortex-lytic enzyme n=1 Tax=Fervidicella metallireducens AeB TaxID=1403537 RepID=A0A017S0S9_9CLOT|nr:spore cortex-lytic enzyme [Fervidicella metallireducens]EYE89790.1 cell wall hydrolase [Fervidicella metallireducens AeB]
MKKINTILIPLFIVYFIADIITQSLFLKSYSAVISYNVGSNNSKVKQIESKLKQLGFFKGNPDNYYGTDTREAVKKFQRSRGLKIDGITGNATLKALGLSDNQGNNNSSSSKSSQKTAQSADINLLSRAINGEARGEPYVGQVAVGAVIVNRTRDPRFPRTIAGVVYQPGAFTAVSDGQINAKLEDSSLKAARDAVNGWDPTSGCVFYYNPAKTTNKWIWSRPVIKIIGKHHFCK